MSHYAYVQWLLVEFKSFFCTAPLLLYHLFYTTLTLAILHKKQKSLGK